LQPESSELVEVLPGAGLRPPSTKPTLTDDF